MARRFKTACHTSSPQNSVLAAEMTSVFIHFTKTITASFPEYTEVKSAI